MKVLQIIGALIAWAALTLMQLAVTVGMGFGFFALSKSVVSASGRSPDFGGGQDMVMVSTIVLTIAGFVVGEIILKRLKLDALRSTQNPAFHIMWP